MNKIQEMLDRTVVAGTCLLWLGAKRNSGRMCQAKYPHVRHQGKAWGGHRLMYHLFYGEFDKKLHVRHKCDNTLCMNPAHLELGSHVDNMRDKIKRGRDHNKVKTHCKEGHEFTPDNTYIRKDGARTCRTCRKKWILEYDARNREKRRVSALKRYYASRGG